jgi:hypothetical protein
MAEYLETHSDAELNLIPESPDFQPNYYWLFNDNFLASLALKALAVFSKAKQKILAGKPNAGVVLQY